MSDSPEKESDCYFIYMYVTSPYKERPSVRKLVFPRKIVEEAFGESPKAEKAREALRYVMMGNFQEATDEQRGLTMPRYEDEELE